MTEKILSTPELEGLIREFNEVETRFGSDFHNKYEQIVAKLEKPFEINSKGGV